MFIACLGVARAMSTNADISRVKDRTDNIRTGTMEEGKRGMGRTWEGLECIGKVFEPGTIFRYSIYVPRQAIEGMELGLYVMLEYDRRDIAPIVEDLIDEGIMPAGMFLFVNAGTLRATREGGTERDMRAEEFDQYGREFSDFLVEELVPAAAKTAGVALSASPDMHLITGGSSGGLCAWNAAWFRNDYFRRVFLSSPTFSAMRGGEEPMVLLRKTESRPIRIYMTVGTSEPDYYFGSSFYAACNAWKAFQFAKYDAKFELFPGEGHCCRMSDPRLLRQVMQFLWNNWKTEPVRTLGNQIRINQILEQGSVWEETRDEFPSRSLPHNEHGVYSFDGARICLSARGREKRIVADCFGDITGIALSSDRWRMYIADRKRRFVYAMSIMPDGSLGQLYKLASLHLAQDCRTIGASDLCVDASDRVYAATELGIQGMISFGMTDLILPLPGDLPADAVAFGGPGRNVLYAASGKRIFKRKLRVCAQDPSVQSPPTTPKYGDGFDYSIPHLPQ